MPRLIGPDFIRTQVSDLDATRTLHTEVLRLTAATNEHTSTAHSMQEPT